MTSFRSSTVVVRSVAAAKSSSPPMTLFARATAFWMSSITSAASAFSGGVTRNR